MKMRCSCGAWLAFPTDMPLAERDEQARQFFEKHNACRIKNLKPGEQVDLLPGQILETIDAPNYTDVLNKIAEHLSNIESNTRSNSITRG